MCTLAYSIWKILKESYVFYIISFEMRILTIDQRQTLDCHTNWWILINYTRECVKMHFKWGRPPWYNHLLCRRSKYRCSLHSTLTCFPFHFPTLHRHSSIRWWTCLQSLTLPKANNKLIPPLARQCLLLVFHIFLWCTHLLLTSSTAFMSKKSHIRTLQIWIHSNKIRRGLGRRKMVKKRLEGLQKLARKNPTKL